MTFGAGDLSCCFSGKQEINLRESQRFRKKEEVERLPGVPESTGKSSPECSRVGRAQL